MTGRRSIAVLYPSVFILILFSLIAPVVLTLLIPEDLSLRTSVF